MKLYKLFRKLIIKSIFGKSLTKIENIKFKGDFEKFTKLSSIYPSRFEINWKDIYPIFSDATQNHDFDRHYIYHTGWAARKLKEILPNNHVDISSSLYFNAITSAFIPISFYDFRSTNLALNQLKCNQADITKLPFTSNSIQSISCMHVIEHIGLGRYGDDLNPNGDLEAFNELIRVVKPGGSILLVVPIGKSKIIFNAHRIYSFNQIIEYFNKLNLIEFSLVTDSKNENFIINATEIDANKQEFGCGCFWFRKQ